MLPTPVQQGSTLLRNAGKQMIFRKETDVNNQSEYGSEAGTEDGDVNYCQKVIPHETKIHKAPDLEPNLALRM